MITETIIVKINNIDIGDTHFSFNYEINRYGKVIKTGVYKNSHKWKENKDKFKIMLERFYAVELALKYL